MTDTIKAAGCYGDESRSPYSPPLVRSGHTRLDQGSEASPKDASQSSSEPSLTPSNSGVEK